MFSDKQLKDMILPLLMEYPDLSDNTTAHKNFCGFQADRTDDPQSGIVCIIKLRFQLLLICI